MLFFYIASTDRTEDVEKNTFRKSDELQQKVDIAEFNLISGARPTQNQEVVVYDGFLIQSLSGTTLTLKNGEQHFNKFRANDEIWLGLGETTEEKVTISSVSADGLTITLTANAQNAHSEDEQMGKKVFGGTVQGISDQNLHSLSNLIIKVKCADYTKIFDKKLINESWKDRTSEYIIRSFLNSTINFNELIDDFEYANATAIRAVWAESDDGDDPNIDTTNFKETDTSGIFPWTNSGGAAKWDFTFTSINIVDLVGVSSGQPTKGILNFWYKQDDYTTVTDIRFRIGSSSSDYVEAVVTPESDNDWNYASVEFNDLTPTGTPDWTAMDYVQLIVNQTGSSQVNIDGLRVNATGSFTFTNVLEGLTFDDFRSSYKKPTEIMQKLADQNLFNWYIDYDRDIHFFSTETNNAPFSLNNTSNNFSDLKISTTAEKIVNRQTVRGANETSSNKTDQSIPGDGKRREWVLRNKFRNLTVLIDTSGTGTFATSSVGIDFLDAETTSAYFSNYNAQSVRAAASTSTPPVNSVIRFRYNEIVPIITQSKDNVSINNLRSILGNDGIFDGREIVDRNIKTRVEAEARAKIETDKWSNPIIEATFVTNYEGLRSGQLISIEDTTSGRNISQNFLIQKVTQSPVSTNVNKYTVKCASTVFGIMELLQKLLRDSSNIEVDENETIFNVETSNEIVTLTESWTEESIESQRETVSMTESWTSSILTPPFLYGYTTSNNMGYFDLSSYY